jgi:hypothetical protein
MKYVVTRTYSIKTFTMQEEVEAETPEAASIAAKFEGEEYEFDLNDCLEITEEVEEKE